jgi:hypothetical protein
MAEVKDPGWQRHRSALAARFCWYNYHKRCTQPMDCIRAGLCLDCWNPAEVECMRSGPLWFWGEGVSAGGGR